MKQLGSVVCNPLSPRSLNGISGFVFDCDGVLFDSRDANRRYYNLIRERLGLPPMDGEEEEYVHSHSVTDSVARIVSPELLDDADRVRKSLPYEEMLPFLRPEPGLFELLSTIRDLDFRLAINTNRTTTMEMLLDRFDLEHYFSPVITAAKVSRAKPHPESLHLILDYWKATPGEIIYIGDSDVDEQTAQRAEVQFWAYKNPVLKAQMHISDFWTLRQYILKQQN
ncbi:MAG: HAD family hydrolase [Desulfovibrionales bacterium]